jgi:hypothetical protein
MKVDRAILAAAATIQFASLGLVRSPRIWLLGVILGMVSGTILLLLALGIEPKGRSSQTS